MAQAEVASELVDQSLTVLGPGFTALLKLHNLPPDLPVGLRDVRVDSLHRLNTTLRIGVGYFPRT